MTDRTSSTARRRPKFRFSVRWLLVACTVAGVTLGILGGYWQEAQRQNRAIQRLLDLGSSLAFHDNQHLPTWKQWGRKWVGDSYFAEVRAIDLTGSSVQDRDLAETLRAFPELIELSWSDTAVTGTSKWRLENHHRLLKIDAGHTPLDDRGLKNLRLPFSIEVLDLDQTRITDEALAELANLPNLRDLRLSHTAVTDAGVPHLAKLSSLAELDLSGTRVTDDGLAALSACGELERLVLHNTSVVGHGCAELSGLTKLKCLELDGHRGILQAVSELLSLSALKELHLSNVEISEAEFDELQSDLWRVTLYRQR